jgi:hypothetical protein
MAKNRLIPFKLLPASWGLKGEYFDRAEANYLFEGYDLALRLAEIDLGVETIEFKRRQIELDHEYGYIDEYTRDLRLLEHFEGDEETKMVAEVELEVKHGKIDPKQGDKIIATAKGEPWIGVINDNFDHYLGTSGFEIEFDWNDLWIEKLRANGYQGLTEEDVVEHWFQEVCRREAENVEEGPTFNGGNIWVS